MLGIGGPEPEFQLSPSLLMCFGRETLHLVSEKEHAIRPCVPASPSEELPLATGCSPWPQKPPDSEGFWFLHSLLLLPIFALIYVQLPEFPTSIKALSQ